MSLKNRSFTTAILTSALSTGMAMGIAGCDKADVRLDAQGQGTFSMPLSETQ
jgi:hypothetical protein